MDANAQQEYCTPVLETLNCILCYYTNTDKNSTTEIYYWSYNGR